MEIGSADFNKEVGERIRQIRQKIILQEST